MSLFSRFKGTDDRLEAIGGASVELLSSARVLPRRLLAAGYRYEHPGLAGALAAELSGHPS